VSSVVGDSHMNLKYCRRHLLTVIKLAVSCSLLYFACGCPLKRAGAFACRKARLSVYLN